MKQIKTIAIIIMILLTLTACKSKQNETPKAETNKAKIVEIALSDNEIKVDGKKISDDNKNAVYTKNDIVYYESGKDFTYGEGNEKDAHSKEEADAHKVIHISKSGTYSISGKLSKGQIAIDLGENAKNDEKAVVTLILNNADISCDVAPAVIFYNVYECANSDTENATKDVDTSKAGANVIIADGTTNIINGSYVERIYKPDSVVLNSDNTAVEDADKLHKYDGAFYSKMSMNINGGKKNTGVLNINAENEGLDSEMHLTINGGNINIDSGNDGINTNEDGVSVTTINNGALKINVTGETGEGDGIDSNGWLVINGGTVIASACSDSADAGIDSDMGIHINGGTIIASGHMLDRIENGGQTYAVFNFSEKQKGTNTINLKNADSDSVINTTLANDYSVLIISSPQLTKGTYTLYSNDIQLKGVDGGMFGGHGGGMTPPEGFEPPEGLERPEGSQPPQGMEKPEGMEPPQGFEKPEGMEPPQGFEKPEGMEPPQGFEKPEGMEPPQGERPQKPDMSDSNFNPDNADIIQETTTDFIINDGANMFANVGYKK